MTSPDIEPISFDPRGAIGQGRPLNETGILATLRHMEAAWQEMLTTDLELLRNSPEQIPPNKFPLDAGFIELPKQLLEAHTADDSASVIAKIVAAARRLRTADRLIILAAGGAYLAANALVGAFCHTFHNELSRSERRDIPRIYFAGHTLDNDALQALLDLFRKGPPRDAAQGTEDRWAILVIDPAGGTMEVSVALRQLLPLLQVSVDNDSEQIAERLAVVTREGTPLEALAKSLGVRDLFHFPARVGERFSMFSPLGLLPAAVLGLDVVRFLEGAALITEHFRDASPPENAVMLFAAIGHMLESGQNINTRILCAWSLQLEGVGRWYEQVFSESLGKFELGAFPLTMVATRDLLARGQQHQEGRRDKYIVNLLSETCCREVLRVEALDVSSDGLNEFAARTLPELNMATLRGTNAAYNEYARATTELSLPTIDEASLGQLFQFLMLATVVEGRHLKINPYGEPGLARYRENTWAELRLPPD